DLREVDLQENEVEDLRGQWLSCFPDSCTSLVTLNFTCLKGEVNSGDPERLVARCPNLRSLRHWAMHVNSVVADVILIFAGIICFCNWYGNEGETL
ncbi:hypothetical protein MKW94_010427, partial [Papaver nudicaule]|nr:hypothetical protein [Papaver nudicaule]